MGNAFITRRGGGAGANFKVIAVTSAPSGTARENTIAVLTTDKIGNVFMVNEATWTASDGDIAIEYQASAGFNVPNFAVIKKPEVVAKPTACKQYTAAGWVMHDAWIYTQGSWYQFAYARFYIVQNGVQQSGYELTRLIRSNAGFTRTTSGGVLTVRTNNSGYTTGVATAAKAPLSRFTNLVLEVQSVNRQDSSNYAELAVWNDSINVSTEKDVFNAARSRTQLSTGARTYRVPCASYGDSYVGILARPDSANIEVKLTNMYLE